MPSSIRILTVDDHALLREGICAMLEAEPDFTVVGAAATARAGIDAFRRLHPDITLMDLQLPDFSGIEAIRQLRAEFPRARIVVLTTYRGDVNARDALSAGAQGYLLKSVLRAELVEAIRRVHAGHRHVCAEVASDLACHIGEQPLTPREAAILQLVSQGLGNKQIASTLTISSDTVKAHIANLFDKLGARTRTEATAIAARRGFLTHS
jgi:two-component system, NarL family, response regulator